LLLIKNIINWPRRMQFFFVHSRLSKPWKKYAKRVIVPLKQFMTIFSKALGLSSGVREKTSSDSLNMTYFLSVYLAVW
jgi:hypothetical protein